MRIITENIFFVFANFSLCQTALKKNIFVIIVFLFSSPLHPQSIFTLQNPAYSPEQINCIAFAGSYGICAGNYGMIIQSNNGGSNWTGVNAFTTSDIGRIFLFEQSYGCLTADSNKLYLTSNGGSNWQSLYEFENRINDLYFLNKNTGYAVTGNKLHKTTDGGDSWTYSYPYTSGQSIFSCVYFTDQFTGYLSTKDPVSTYACILRTTNGGQNWFSFNTYIDEFEATKMFFLNANTGWCAGRRFDKVFAMRTTDGGANWSEGAVPSSAGAPVGMSYSPITGGFLVTENRVYRSADYGSNWTLYRGGIGYTSSYLKNDSMLYISDVTGALSRLNVNSGLTVTILGLSNSTLSKISAVSRNYSYVKGANSTFFKTNNSGNNWIPDPETGAYNFADYFFTDSITGYGVSGRGDIMKTYYFGTTWDRIYTSSYEFNNVYFFNSNTGWVFGNGMLLKTQNAGMNWQVINTSQNFYDPQFISVQSGYCAGNNNLFFTSDGGLNWVQRGQGVVQVYNFVNENTGWATNSYDTVTYIYRTTDGGVNLNEISYVNESASEIKFLNANTGYLCGRKNLYRTTNSGYTWKPARYPVSDRIRILAMDIIDDNNGWVCGDNSVIIKIVNGGMIYAGTFSEFVPDEFALSQNYPNPFNSNCKFKIENFKLADVELSVYDVTGRKAAVIYKGMLKEGTHEFLFDGAGLSSGIYFYVLKADNKVVKAKKMILIK